MISISRFAFASAVTLLILLTPNTSHAQNASSGWPYEDQGFRAVPRSPLRVAQTPQEPSPASPSGQSENKDQAERTEPKQPTTTAAAPQRGNISAEDPVQTTPTLQRRPPGVGSAETVTLNSIETELKEVSALPESADPIFDEIQSLYQKAKLHITETDSLQGLLAQFQNAIESAPTQLEQTEALLNRTDGESKLAFNDETPVAELPVLKDLEAQKLEKEIKRKTTLKHIETSSPVLRQSRETAIQEQLTKTENQLEEVKLQLNTPPANDNEFFTRARRTQLLAEREMLTLKIKALETESESFDATADLLTVQVELDRKMVTQLTKEIAILDSAIYRRRQDEANRLNTMAVNTQDSVIEPLKKMAASNVKLTERLRRLTKEIDKLSQQAAAIKKETMRVEREQKTMESRIRVVGLSDSFGRMLQRNRNHLIDANHQQSPINQLSRDIANSQIAIFRWDDELELITDIESSAAEIVATLTAQRKLNQQQIEPSQPTQQQSPDSQSPPEIVLQEQLFQQRASADAKKLLKRRTAILTELRKTEEQRFQELVDKKTAQLQLQSASRVYADLIDENILWVRNAPSMGRSDVKDIATASLRLASPSNWQSVWENLRTSLLRRFPVTALLVLSSVTLFLFRHRMITELNQTGQRAIKRGCRVFSVTLSALGQTLLLTATKLSPLLALGAILARNTLGSQFSTSLGWALIYTFLIVFPFELLRQACRKNGLVHSHFNWSEALRKLLKRNFDWVLPVVMPLLVVLLMLPMLGSEAASGNVPFNVSAMTNLVNGGQIESALADDIASSADVVQQNSFSDSETWNRLGRVLLLVVLVIAAIFSASVFHPKGALYADLDPTAGGRNPRTKLRYVGYLVAIAIPLVLAVIAIVGYYYSAIRVGESTAKTIALAILVIILYSVAMRFLLVRRRHLRYEQLVHQRNQARLAAEQKDVAAAASAGAASELIEIDLQNEPGLDITDVSRQARELTAVIFLVVAVGILLSIWQYILPATKIMDDIQLWDVQVSGRTEFVTLRDVMFSTIMFALTYFGVRNMPGMLELLLLQRLPLDAGARYAVTSIFRYILLVIGAILALGYLKIPWSNYSWLVAAISVGLGFGLQEIVANFVSGLILLLERPVRVGDVVTIDGTTGVVSRIQMRATTVTNWDNQELVVPNKDLISGKLLNWTLSSVVNRLSLKFGVAYGTDPSFVRQIVLDEISTNRALLQEPKPMVTFEQFGDSSLNFTLRCCVSTIERRWQIVHDLNVAINKILKEHDIEIPFPQRDLHIIDGNSPLEVADESSDEAN